MVAEAEPETTPQISPTTSLQMELTRSAFRSRRMDSWAPGTFRAAMEWKGFSSAVATAIPTISKTIPIRMITSRIAKASRVPLTSMMASEIRLMVPEIKIVTKKIVTTHLTFLFRSRLDASGSAFAKRICPFWLIIF